MQTEWSYAAFNRPPFYGAVPKGSIRVDPAPANWGHIARHGLVVYNRELTDKECYDYELYPFKTVDQVARMLLDNMGAYADEYLEMADEHGAEQLRSIMPRGFYSDVPPNELFTLCVQRVRDFVSKNKAANGVVL